MIEEIDPLEPPKKKSPVSTKMMDAYLASLQVPELGVMQTASGVKTLSLELEGDDTVKEETLDNMRKELEETSERARDDQRAADLNRLKGRIANIPTRG